jgi:two-component system, response regulator YesN
VFSVLVVENHEFFRKSFAGLLQRYLPEVHVEDTGDGLDALRRIDSSVPDVVFLDVRLPGKNGWVLAKEIKAKYPHIKIGFISCYDMPEYRSKAFRNGADYFFNKEALCSVEILSVLSGLLADKLSSP